MSVPKCPYCFARCQNIHVPKCSGAKISICQNVQVPKYLCRSVLVANRPSAKKSLCQNALGGEMSMCWYIRRAETCTCRNILVMKCQCWNASFRNVSCQNGGKLCVPIWLPSDLCYEPSGSRFLSIFMIVCLILLLWFAMFSQVWSY